jgi:hypothetical protein
MKQISGEVVSLSLGIDDAVNNNPHRRNVSWYYGEKDFSYMNMITLKTSH